MKRHFARRAAGLVLLALAWYHRAIGWMDEPSAQDVDVRTLRDQTARLLHSKE